MKLRVFLRVYTIPILLVILLLVRLQALTAFRTYTEIAFIISASLVILLSENKYIETFSVGTDRITVKYLTQFLQTRSIKFEQSQISEVKLSKKRQLPPIWPPVLYVKLNGEWIWFFILTKELYNEIHDHFPVTRQSVA